MTISQDAKRHGLTPLKKYSQNFIFDSTLCDKIVKSANIVQTDHVLEIGSGPAGLTKSIIKAKPLSFTVVEIDQRCISLLLVLQKTYQALEIIENDALAIDIESIIKNHKQRLCIISNLPYSIATVLLIKYLKSIQYISKMVLMFQSEVADRIRAKVSTAAYSRISVISQVLCFVEKVLDVNACAFYPKPKVNSTVIKFVPKNINLNLSVINKLEDVTKNAFSQRRKMVKSSMKNLLSQYSEDIFHELKIDSHKRAQDITVEEYLLLAQYLSIKERCL